MNQLATATSSIAYTVWRTKRSSFRNLSSVGNDSFAPLYKQLASQQLARITTDEANINIGHNKCWSISSKFSTVIERNDQSKFSEMLLSLSPRRKLQVEERLVSSCNITDSVVNLPLRKLGWLKSISFPSTLTKIDDTSLENLNHTKAVPFLIHLELPSMLHPNLAKLKSDMLESITKELELLVMEFGAKDNAGSAVPLIDISKLIDVQFDVKAASALPMTVLRGSGRRVTSSPTFVFGLEDEEKEQKLQRDKLGPGLANVTHFVAVYSCKGGVGKSTVATNLAFSLAKMGGRIGLLDVDVYGPSLPVLVKPNDDTIRTSPLGSSMVYPIEHEGVKMISLGFVSPKSGVPGSGTDTGASVMRGPMASKVVTQLLKGTDWGEVDILILDMPPGTGDVQLTVCQDLTLSGAVCVTTPSKLAAADAEKGIDMFTSLGVPTLAAVLNMSYFECDGGGRHYPFGGNGGGDSLAKSLKVSPSHIFHMPVSTAINSANEDGNPICLSTPTGANAELSAFADLARLVSHELYVLQHGGNLKSRKGGEDNFDGIRVKFDEEEEFDASNIILTADNKRKRFVVRFFSEVGATQKNVNGKDLIGRNPKTGDKLVNEVEAEGETSNHNHSNLFPAKIERKGYYGYSVEWASGATMIYSMLSICKSAGGKIV